MSECVAVVDETRVTRGCSCGWVPEPWRSDKPSWAQWVEHKTKHLVDVLDYDEVDR